VSIDPVLVKHRGMSAVLTSSPPPESFGDASDVRPMTIMERFKYLAQV